MGWLKQFPIVSLLLAVAMLAAPTWLARQSLVGAETGYERTRDVARDFLLRHPQLDVDAVGEGLLGRDWLEAFRASDAPAETSTDIRLPPRMLARSQAKLDGMLDDAHAWRMRSDPTWRYGVVDFKSSRANLVAHVFVHPSMVAMLLSVAVLVLVGAPLERVWGSIAFGAFAIVSGPVVVGLYRLLDGSSGIPWSGGAGLAAALLGAYFIRGLGGRFWLPGWILLPAWIGVEVFVVRDFWIDDLGRVPWATLCGAVGWGALVAGGLGLTRLESRRSNRSSRGSRGPNPIVSRAARLRSDGDPYQAFDLIQTAWRDTPEDEDVAEAFFSIAVEVGQPEAAAGAILPRLRNAVREGALDQALDYWLPLASRKIAVDLEATPLVRLSEALLDAGNAEEALFSLGSALDHGVSSAHATRIVKIARDLDPALARRAALVALEDPALDPRIRSDLEVVADVPDAEPPAAADSKTDAPTLPAAPTPLDRRVHAEHQPIETTAFPLDADSDLDLEIDEKAAGAASTTADNEEALSAQALDEGALSEERLAGEDAGSTTIASPADAPPSVASPADVLSHWGEDQRGPVDPSELTGMDLADDSLAEALLDVDDLESPDLSLGSMGSDSVFANDGAEDETDSDLTPMMDATDELTSPCEAHTVAMVSPDTSQPVFDQPTTFMERPQADMASDEISFATDTGEQAATRILSLRGIKARVARPVSMDGDSIEIEVVDRGKSNLPIGRIQAIAMSAVLGLEERPVLVIDLVLNWHAHSSEVLKSIRLRSDQFDPATFAPDASSPLEALSAWIREIESLSGATCLPGRDILAGQFARHESLEAYERDVLMARAED